MMVVWVHSLYVIPGIAERLGPPSFVPNSAVDIFFLISGFVMVVTTTRKAMSPAEFFRLRVVRVIPLYWLATIAMIAIAVIASAASGRAFRDTYTPSMIVKSLLFIPYGAIEGVPGGVWPILQQGWTLNYEMFFYALFALSLAAPRRLGLPALVMTLALLVVLGGLYGPFVSPLASVYTNPLLLEFLLGMILARRWLRDGLHDWFPLSVALIVLGLYGIGSQHRGFVTMGSAFFIFAGCLHPKMCAIQSRPLMELGNASYSIYLVHQFVLEALAWLWLRAYPLATWASSVTFMALALALCAAAGLLGYWFIEKPLTTRLLGLLRKSAPVGAVVEAR
jgi:exopolysaccharide production protein ExoZ